ncbi:CBF/Mak21 family-domain-containing protein [Crepidotus variabilis]|uniref:CBF/Mak21 family-domain-containing protein n=1 Tax=Crepidotus variabilis TaxID=179855 RepID=A0A9P6EHB3_9AGAR|nr:CBF/Mak21 family-domain-containing protein [Crepidotus variabilis]
MPAPVSSLPPLAKRRKIYQTDDTAQKIKQFEANLTKAAIDQGPLNLLVDLLLLTTEAEDPHDTSKGIYSLYRVFVTIITSGKLGVGEDESSRAVKAWILEKLQTFVDFLGGLLQDQEKFLRISSLQILFSLLKHLSTAYTKASHPTNSQPQFHVSHFRKVVSFLLLGTSSSRKTARHEVSNGVIDPDVLTLFHDTWLSVHDDIRWFFLREAATLLKKHNISEYPHLTPNILSCLEQLSTFPTEQAELNTWWITELGTRPPKPKRLRQSDDAIYFDNESMEKMDEDDDWRKFFDEEEKPADPKSKPTNIRLHKMTLHQSLHSLASHRAVFTRAWLTLLPRLSDAEVEKTRTFATRALNVMHRGVMPHLSRVILVMDWISYCVDLGGSVGLLALNALFVLMKEYNLDYPSFYTRLYGFLDRDVLHLKHRARFFRLTEVFLSSSHLPSALLASFIKKLSRLSLYAPPAAVIMVIPFTYNILKHHPALMPMIHRPEMDDLSGDPFLADEKDPMKTLALESSLWELLSHSSHYHAPVSTLSKVFSEAFTKNPYSMEDFLDHTYSTLIETELNRKIKREPPLALVKTAKVFPIKPSIDENVSEGSQVDVVEELWAFG